MTEERELTFYVKRWLSDEEFRDLLKIARYVGRTPKGSQFVLDLNRISRNRIDPEEVLAILEDVDAEFEGATLKDIEKILDITRPQVVVKKIGEDLVIEPKSYIKPLLDEARSEVLKKFGFDSNAEERVYRYDRDRKIYVVEKPMYLLPLLEELAKRGVKVVNEAGISDSLPLPIHIELKTELRPYQKEALDAWIGHGYRGVISLPTGSGKTVVGIAAIATLNVRTLIVAYTKDQMFQWAEQIVKHSTAPREMVGFFYGEEKKLAPITITTYQTAYRYIKKLAPYYSLLIVDEVHHLPAEKFRFIAENALAKYRMGLSATIVREDGRHTELFRLMGGVVYHKSAKELAEQGYLAPFRIITVRVNLTPEERAKYRALLERYRSLVGMKSFEEVLALARQGDPQAIEALKTRSELRQLVHNSIAKLAAVKKIVEQELAQGSKIIVFTQYVEQAKKLAELLGAYYITGELDEVERKRRLSLFRDGLTRVLIVTTVGDEGIDVPDANVGIIVAGTGSRRQFLQRLGRLLRPAPGKEARLYEIVVKGTFEEFEAQKRKQLYDLLTGGDLLA